MSDTWQYYNPNPKHHNPVGDCIVRAVAKALHTTWESAFIDLATQGYSMGDMPSSNAVLASYLRSKGFRKHAIDEYCSDCYTFEDFANEHFKGTYILATGTHVACVIDGIIYDAWDSSDCVPIYYFERYL